VWPLDTRPKIYGKFGEGEREDVERLASRADQSLPAHYELSPVLIAKAIAQSLAKFDLPADVSARIAERIGLVAQTERRAAKPRLVAERKAWFCSGCPHDTSTSVPDGSRALAGIGCHFMSIWMDRNTETFSQMGGEGAAWLGQMHFRSDKHVFVNLGDGTYFHSGFLAIRAAIAAAANVTCKILYNDAVAMTGGQPLDGTLSVPQIACQLMAEGAKQVVVVTDEPGKYRTIRLPEGVEVHHRDKLDAIQRELRDTAGTTVLIYDQVCATEKRRRRKRGTYPDLARHAFINEAVCEGCGDCSVQSNCLLVEPWLAKRDERGHLVKRRFGPWVLPAFRILAKLKGLRGGRLDVFGKTQERRTERRLIAEYAELVDTLCASLTGENLDIAVKLAQLPDEIRGFGHVKERNLAAVEKKRGMLLVEYSVHGRVNSSFGSRLQL
jgi:indolepyruvate ferredoxin oxidoreductase